MAERIVSLAIRPRRALHLGLQHALAPGYLLMPDTTRRLTGRLPQHFLFRSGPPTGVTNGVLFKPMADGTGTRGGWGDLQQQRRSTARSVGTIGLAGLATLRFVGGVCRML